MNRLFWKIFISFWLAMLLIVAATTAINQFMLRSAGLDDFPDAVQERMAFVAERAARDIQRGGTRVGRRGMRGPLYRAVRLFDDDGEQLSGPPLPAQLRHLTKITERTEGPGFVAIPVTNDNGELLRVVAATRLPPRALFGGPRSSLLRLAVAAAVSALICWILARYLSGPIQRLRAASQRLAAGDLAARTAVDQKYATDEIGDLGREFDHMAERLQQSRASQQQLLRDVSHELRSPLARLQVAVGLARQRLGDDDSTPELDRIEAEAEKLDELIGEILTLTRQLESDATLELAPVDLAELVRVIVDDANYEAEQSEQSVRFDPELEALSIVADTKLLSRAVENVIRNALHHAPTGSTVEVDLATAADHAVITISDRGPGVPSTQLERIFDPFHQVDPARTLGGGYGLGLAIARTAMERHGGTIAARNRDDGGLSVQLRLPLNNDIKV